MKEINLLKYSNVKSNHLTRNFICEALILLLKTKKFDDITIVELCNTANVSRQAFYNNYKDKREVFYDIIIKINEEVLNKLGRPFTNNIDLKWYENFYETVSLYSPIILNAYECGFQADYLNITNEIIINKLDVKNELEKYKRLVWNGAIQNLMHEWIINGKKESVSYMARLTYDIFYGGK